jgi:hypothetical protein
MVKWIKADELPAQRTIGGQFRILVDDLRQFMVRNEMSTALLDSELNCRPYCWEYHCQTHRGADAADAPCHACPVRRARALDCFELRAERAGGTWACADCRACSYFRTWAKPRRDE